MPNPTMMLKRFSVIAFAFLLLASCSSHDSQNTPAPINSELPSLYADENGDVVLSWVESFDDGMSTLKYSILSNKTWSTSREIAAGNDWFVNWADYPSVISKEGEPLAAHWLQKVPGGPYAYNIQVSTYQGDKTWLDSFTPHKDSTATEHGFVSMIPWQENNVLAIWLDGRETAGRTNAEYSNLEKAMTLRSGVFNTEGELINNWLLDGSVCDCCNTGLAATEDGAIAVYRERTEGEIRDIYFTKLKNGTWSDPKPVAIDNWNITACPVNGPKIAAQDSTVLVAWYTAAKGKRSVKAAISYDSGESFEEPIVINQDNSIGRVDVAIAQNGKLFISWMQEAGDGIASLNITQLANDEVTTNLATKMNASRSSGFPQMEITGREIVLAWTDLDDEGTKQVKTKIIPFK